MLRTLLSACLVLLIALAIVGFTLSRTTEPRADFRFVNFSEPKTLDPDLMTGEPEGRIAEAIFEGLTRMDARSLEPVPGVAESWEISPDGKTYTFHLRKDARWTDGHPLTAQDFIYGWRRLQDPTLGAPYAYIMHMVRYAEALNTYGAQGAALEGPVQKAALELEQKYPGGVPVAAIAKFASEQHLDAVLKGAPDDRLQAFVLHPVRERTSLEMASWRAELAREGKRRRELYEEAKRHYGIDGGIFAKDEHTLIVELIAPTPYFLELTAFYPSFPIPRWAVEHSGGRNWFLPDRIVSNGAFRLSAWRLGNHIRLERSDAYWGRDQVKLQTADVLPIENTTTALNLYLTGEVDWLPHNTYPLDLAPELKQRSDYYFGPALIIYYYRFNCTRKPFNDVRVRKALNLAIDREQITRDVLAVGQQPATHLVPPGIRGYTPPESGIRYDVEAARRLLAEAGFPNGEGFPHFGILFNTAESHKKVADVLADQLRRNLHIEATSYNQEWQSFLQSTRSLDYDVARAAWIGDYEDPNSFLDLMITNGGNNQTGWGNAVYDRLLESAANVESFIAEPEFILKQVQNAAQLRQLADRVRASQDAPARLENMAALRMQLLAEAEGILVRDEFPIMPIYVYTVSGLVNPKVKGLYTVLEGSDGKKRPNLRERHPLQAVYIDEAKAR